MCRNSQKSLPFANAEFSFFPLTAQPRAAFSALRVVQSRKSWKSSHPQAPQCAFGSRRMRGEDNSILPNGKLGAPCGACREWMVRLLPDRYQGIEVLMDFETEETVTLGELTPKWWI